MSFQHVINSKLSSRDDCVATINRLSKNKRCIFQYHVCRSAIPYELVREQCYMCSCIRSVHAKALFKEVFMSFSCDVYRWNCVYQINQKYCYCSFSHVDRWCWNIYVFKLNKCVLGLIVQYKQNAVTPNTWTYNVKSFPGKTSFTFFTFYLISNKLYKFSIVHNTKKKWN